MSISFSSFSLYEFLRILFPGTYLFLNILYFINYFFDSQFPLLDKAEFNHSGVIIVYLICSFILGILIYSIDNPNLLRKILKKSLPTNLIVLDNPEIDKVEIANSYFTFYDKLPGEYQLRSERQIGFFHISVDLVLVGIISLILMVLCIFFGKPKENMKIVFSSHLKILIGLTIISLISSRLIFTQRLKEIYERNLKMYYKSTEYNELKHKITDPEYSV